MIKRFFSSHAFSPMPICGVILTSVLLVTRQEPLPAQNPSSIGLGGTNYISKTVYTTASADSSYTDVTYYDGLGYPVQEMSVAAGGTGEHIIRPIVYDVHHRPDSVSYLPFAISAPTAAYDGQAMQHQAAFHYSVHGDGHPFSLGEYETWGGGRLLSSLREGDLWSQSDKRVTCVRRQNTLADSLILLRYVWSPERAVQIDQWQLAAGSLICDTTTDEDGCVTSIFSDGFGKTFCTRQSDGDTNADTYYVYDLKDSLVCVVQPEGTARIKGDTVTRYTFSSALAHDQFFTWRYDAVGDVVEAHVPGGGTSICMFDRRRRPVMDATAVMLEHNIFHLVQYDSLDRVTREKIITIPTGVSLESIRSYVLNLPPVVTDQMIASLPGVTVVRTIRECEYYPFTSSSQGQQSSIPAANDFLPVAGVVSSSDRETVRIKGLLRSEVMREIPSPESTASDTSVYVVTRYYYYDNRGRVIQTAESDSEGWATRTSVKYDFMGNVLVRQESHAVTSVTNGCPTGHQLTETHSYDKRGRLLTTERTLDNIPLAGTRYVYDPLARQVATVVENDVVRNATYDMHDWITSNTVQVGDTTVFGQTLRYQSPSMPGTAALYSGQISEITSKYLVPSTAAIKSNTYGYAYDGLKRLTDASHFIQAASSESSSDTEKDISYDRNGNILSLKRYGASGLGNNLTYGYLGNKLTTLIDSAAAGGAATYSFTYDSNGNMLTDSRKGLRLSYNVINQPSEIVLINPQDNNDTTVVSYRYLPDGAKISSTVGDGSGRLYRGAFIYDVSSDDSRSLESVGWEEGRTFVIGTTQQALPDGSGITTDVITSVRDEWYAKDHIGGVRVVVDVTPLSDGQHSPSLSDRILEQNDYLPFGTKIDGLTYASSTTNRWRYAGKEEQVFGSTGATSGTTSINLGLLDFGARYYDSFIGRWITVDPMANNYNSYSPFAYCLNNPFFLIDPSGSDVILEHWVGNENMTIGGYWATGVGQELMKAIDGILETEVGYNFVAQFAKAGQKIGSHLFTSDGMFSDSNLTFREYALDDTPVAGSFNFSNTKNNISFNIKINTAHGDVVDKSITLGHELFIHMKNSFLLLYNAFKEKDIKRFKTLRNLFVEHTEMEGEEDHIQYLDNPYSNTFDTFVKQLNGVYPPSVVKRARNEHDNNLKKTVAK